VRRLVIALALPSLRAVAHPLRKSPRGPDAADSAAGVHHEHRARDDDQGHHCADTTASDLPLPDLL
jgi:hypothetical protein